MWDLKHFRRMWREAFASDKCILMCYGAFAFAIAGFIFLRVA